MQPRKLANIVCSWVYFLIGGVYAAFQVLIPRIIASLGGSAQAVSLLVASLFLGSVLTTLVSGEISERFGKRTTVLISCIALTVGCLLVLSANDIWVAILGLLVSGFGIGGNEGATMSIIEDANPDNSDRVLCYVMALYGLGGFLVPLLVESAFGESAYKPVMILFAVLYALSSVLTFLSRGIDQVCIFHGGEQKGLTISIVWKNRILFLSILALAMYCGLESGLTYYATEVFGLFGDVSAGSYAVSAYWLAVMVGSFTGGLFKNTLKYLSALLVGGGILVALVLLVPTMGIKVALMFFIGILFGPAYGLISYLGGHSAPENSGMAYAAMAFGASIGGVAFQPLAAVAIQWFPITATYVLVILLTIADAFLIKRIREKSSL